MKVVGQQPTVPTKNQEHDSEVEVRLKGRKYLSFLVHGKIVDQIETTIDDEETIALDEMLRRNGCLGDHQEVALTEDIND